MAYSNRGNLSLIYISVDEEYNMLCDSVTRHQQEVPWFHYAVQWKISLPECLVVTLALEVTLVGGSKETTIPGLFPWMLECGVTLDGPWKKTGAWGINQGQVMLWIDSLGFMSLVVPSHTNLFSRIQGNCAGRSRARFIDHRYQSEANVTLEPPSHSALDSTL